MILVVGGTKESIEIVDFLGEQNPNKNYSADIKSIHGESISKGIFFIPRSLNSSMTAKLIKSHRIKTLIDASPIHSKRASLKTMKACTTTNTRYIRYQPPAISIKNCSKVYRVKGIEEACEKAMGVGSTVFLNIGNNNIKTFAERGIAENKKVVVRVSDTSALTHSLKYGVHRHNILFVEGLFSEAFNRGVIKEYDISVYVTRDLGEGNGTTEEISAAIKENIPVVLIERPILGHAKIITDYAHLAQEVFE
jgi:precorrin-6A/cobalt-precorrin-6A reductase